MEERQSAPLKGAAAVRPLEEARGFSHVRLHEYIEVDQLLKAAECYYGIMEVLLK